MRSSEVMISPMGQGFQLGQGVYTSLKIKAGKPVFFEEHLRRLSGDVKAIGLTSVLSGSLEDRCLECIRLNGVSEGAMKVIRFQDQSSSSELVQLRGPSPLLAVKERGARLSTVKGPAAGSLVARHKTIAYVAHQMARREALAQGFDEALWVTPEGALLECSAANIFVVLNGELLTPPVTAGILPGVVREVILRGYPGARAANISAGMLAGAEEVFVSNSLIGVLPVLSVDAKTFEPGRRRVVKLVAEYLEEQE